MIEAAAPKTERRRFEADVERLLHLMVHSVYSDRSVFLRELVSNAADACEKLRYEALTTPDLAPPDGYAIRVSLDPEAKTLEVADDGIGMSHDDLVHALGAIARSGTRAFLDKLTAEEAGKEGARLIGQFGIGFYSSFMVASSVEVVSRRAGDEATWVWRSQGGGDYEIAPAGEGERLARAGTRVRLSIKDEADEFLDAWRIEDLLREHSGAVAVPIDLVAKPGEAPKRTSDGAALWLKPKSEVTEEAYADFFKTLSGQVDAPALTVHWHAEGRQEFTALAFVPAARPLDLFDPERKGRGKLYVRRVLIDGEASLLPGWLRFVKIVVDSADLPLNVSREMIQESPLLAAIRRAVATRILSELVKCAENDGDKFTKIWKEFGPVLKEGLYEDPERRDQLFKIARFATSTHPDGGRTLAQYVADLRPNQTAIHCLVGDDAKRLASSPQLEGFRALGVEVLLLSDPVDAFWITTAVGFDGKPFRSVTQGKAEIDAIPLVEGAAATGEADASVAALMAYFKQTLEGEVADVRASSRLAESPACLVAESSGPDRRLERMLAQHGKLEEATKPVLEINPGHALVKKLAAAFGSGARDDLVDYAHVLVDEARLRDGEPPADAAAFAARLSRLMSKALG